MTAQEWLYVRTTLHILSIHLASIAFYFPLTRLANIGVNLETYSVVAFIVASLFGLKYFIKHT
jgi:hypothetical protein